MRNQTDNKTMPTIELLEKPRISKPRIWTPAVSRAWDLPEALTVSQWADRSRILGPENAEPGPWKTDRTPYLRGIMDAFGDPHVERITMMTSTQVGKSESQLNMLGYAIDQDPGPAMVVMPTVPICRSFSYKRMIPMLFISPDLYRHITPNTDDLSKMEMTLDRMTVYMAGAESPAALSSRAIRYAFFDEVDKYPPFSGREADPIELGTERTRTFKVNRKTVECSTPTTEFGYIFRGYEQSDRQKFYVPCPHCGKMQALVWSQVKYAKDVTDPEQIQMRRLAWYECVRCKKRINDGMKQKMLLAGRWLPERNKDEADNPDFRPQPSKHAGYWLNAIYSPWLTFAEIAAKWLKSKDDKALLMNFVNSWLAEPWREDVGKKNTDEIARLELDYDPGVVPSGGLVLTAGVDVQQDHFRYVLRAWGYQQESWLVRSGRLETWEDVIDMLFRYRDPATGNVLQRRYSTMDGRDLAVRLTCIDSGYRSNEVYEICRMFPGLAIPTKGRDHLSGEAFRARKIETDSVGRPIPGGQVLYHLDTSFFKDKIFRLIQATQPGQSGGWHTHKNTPDDYRQEMCAESKAMVVDKRTRRATWEWKLVSQHAANHALDCEVGAAAAAEILRVYNLRPEGTKQEADDEDEPESGRKSRWIRGTSNWLGNR